jgi:hypothetical protein
LIKIKGVSFMPEQTQTNEVKEINARIAHKHDTEANWKLATSFIPLQGELIIYDKDGSYGYERFKIGDGIHNASALPFIGVLEYAKSDNFPTTGTSGRIYVATESNTLYRWNGSEYVKLSTGLELGTTAETAYYGNLGHAAYQHSQSAHAPSNAEANVQSDWNATDTTSDAFIKNKPTLGSLAAKSTVAKSDLATDVQTSLGKADTAVQQESGKGLSTNDYTTDEKNKLAGIESGANNITVDSALSITSTNPVQNKVIYDALNDKVDSATGKADRVVITDTNGDIAVSDNISTVELGYLSGVTRNIQSQLNGKPDNADLANYVPTTRKVNNKTLSADVTLDKSDIGLGNVVNTGDSATPVEGGTTKFTTGGAFTELAKKVDKVSGKGLSTNDFTNEFKNKLAGIASNAEVNVQSDWSVIDESSDAFIKNKPAIPAAYTHPDTHPASMITGLDETTVKLKNDLYTYTSIGKITGASNTSPVKVASTGDTLKDVFNNVFGIQQDEQPTISSASLGVAQTGSTSVTGGEFGKSHSAISASVTFTLTDSATCNYGYRVNSTKTTGSQTVKYPIIKQSEADIKITLPSGQTASSSMVTTGTYVSHDNNVLYCDFNSSNKVTVSFTVPAGNTITSQQTRYSTITGEVSLGNAQTTSGTSITKFLTLQGKDATTSLSGGKKSNTSTAYTISAGYVPYSWELASSVVAPDSDLPSINKRQSAYTSIPINNADGTKKLYIYIPSGITIKEIKNNNQAAPSTCDKTDLSLKVNGQSTYLNVYHVNANVASGNNTFTITYN